MPRFAGRRGRATPRIAGLVLAGLVGACGNRTAPPPVAAPGPLTLAVDATDVGRKLYKVHETVPATPGAMTLVYPKWLPGEHGPTGPITDLVGLSFSVGGKPIGWQRDPVDMYAFHVDVPAGAAVVDVAFEFLSAATTSGFSSAASATPHLAVVTWNQLLLYPEGSNTDQINIQASLTLPAAWQFGTALETLGEKPPPGADIRFQPVSVTTLVDSPVIAGEFFREIPLDQSDRPVFLDVAADSAQALTMSPALTDKVKRLVVEADSLFGARHFDRYHFLLSLSDHVAHFGLEHHQSNDSRVYEHAFLDESPRLGVLAHEFVHSWNGKFRRPSGLATQNFQDPMRGDLLWVYEGLTQYLGYVLAVRSGIWTEQYYRERLAAIAASLDHTSGRDWRPLADTAVAAQLLYAAPAEWAALRRGTDFYDEGWLLWLDVDTQIRQLTGGQKSIDDFCRRFHGGASGSPAVSPYTLDDVVAALNQIAPTDWKAFLQARVAAVTPHPPLDGLDRGGWRLVYNETRNDYLKTLELGENKLTDVAYSLGLRVSTSGTIIDVLTGTPAFAAGLGPGMKIVNVGSKPFTPDVLRTAIAAVAKPGPPLTVQVDNNGQVSTVAIDYRGGLKDPHIERTSSNPDGLALILASRGRR
jgi:predicted metalloprotease with PDZ domain